MALSMRQRRLAVKLHIPSGRNGATVDSGRNQGEGEFHQAPGGFARITLAPIVAPDPIADRVEPFHRKARDAADDHAVCDDRPRDDAG